MANVLLHLGIGLALMALSVVWVRRHPVECGAFLLAGLPAIFLAVRGNTLDHRWALWAHIALAVIAVVVIGIRLSYHGVPRTWRTAFIAAAACLVLLPAASALYQRVRPNPNDRIQNPAIAPISMDHEGGGTQSPFAPSSAQTNTGDIIPSNFFMDSESCGACHKDIYDQWNSSSHHFASFNNQFYRKSIEYMQDVVGTRPSKWCAGCHDHAVFFNGRFDRPIKEQIDTPEAQAGLGCMSCHAIVHVGSSMGNGDFTVEYPPLHELASSKNTYIRAIDYFLTYLNPKPHKATFMKPFMREQSAEYCASCHKVHLDVPVNSYRWVRGFNDYDVTAQWPAAFPDRVRAPSTIRPRPRRARIATCRWWTPKIPATKKARSIRIASPLPIRRSQPPTRMQNSLPPPRNSSSPASSPWTSSPCRRQTIPRDRPQCSGAPTRCRPCPLSLSAKRPSRAPPLSSARWARCLRPSEWRVPLSPRAAPRASMWWFAHARSATSSRAAQSTPSMSGWNCRPATPMAASYSGAAALPTMGKRVLVEPARAFLSLVSSWMAMATPSISEMRFNRAALSTCG